jgi:hypothetical protein
MGVASKVISVIFRVGELICAAIVAGILGRYLHLLDLADVGAGSRIIYSEVIAGLSIAFSIILMPPLMYSFVLFLLDFALFICWMVAFGLLANVPSILTLWEPWRLIQNDSSRSGARAPHIGFGMIGASTGAGFGTQPHTVLLVRLWWIQLDVGVGVALLPSASSEGFAG